MELIEKQEMLGWNDVPVLLCSILQELRVLNGKPAMPAAKQVIIEPKTETVQTAEPQTVETEETDNAATDPATHDEVKALCLELNRKDPANKDKITALIADYTDGKLADVPVAKLPDLKARIEQLNG